MSPFEPPQTSIPSPFGPAPNGIPSPFGPPQRPAKPPASKARWLAIPAVLLVLGGMFYGCLVGFDVAAEPGDRDLVLTVDDVTRGLDFTKDPAKESLKRTWYIDGSREVVYEYDGSEGKMPIYVTSQISRSTSNSDANNEYLGMKLGASAVFSTLGEGITEVPRDDLLRWGEKSTHIILSSAGGNVGNVFVAVRGNKVFMIIVTGVVFDDKASIEGTILPKLTKGSASSL
jgi:hypothetical protein